MKPKKDRVLELAEIIYGQVASSVPMYVEQPIDEAPLIDLVDRAVPEQEDIPPLNQQFY